MRCKTTGKIIKVHKCWWIKVNKKPIRTHALDGAVFPHIVTFTYTVNGVEYTKRKYIGLRAESIGIFGNVDVYYDEEKPSRCEIKL